MDTTPYSKREQDEFRKENKEQFERVMQAINDMNTSQGNEFKKIKDRQGVDHNTLELLCKTVSENSGDIGELKKSHQLIKDVAAFSKVTKFIFYFIIGCGTLYSIAKAIIETKI